MKDLIDRQDAIDAVESTTWYHQGQNGEMAKGASSEEQAWYKAEDIYKALNDLPSAQQNSGRLSGWICPVCGRGLSPYTSVCPCKNGLKGWEITC